MGTGAAGSLASADAKREATIDLDGVELDAELESFTSTEALSQLFVIDAYVRTEEDFDFLPHLGAKATIKVNRDGKFERAFHGELWGAEYQDTSTAGFRYRLTLRPWLYRLSRNADYAIFQDLTTPQIIKKVLDTRGISNLDYKFKFEATFESREYCVQYGESDFAFISRLMEQEGIYYFFEHALDKHTLIFCTSRGSHAGYEFGELPFVSPTGGVQTYDDRVWSWVESVTSGGVGQVRLRDFDYLKPSLNLEQLYAQGERLSPERAEVYRYPGDYTMPNLGKARAQVILESDRRERRLYRGLGDAVTLACGQIIELTEHPVERFNQEYIVAGLIYMVANQKFRSGGADLGSPSEMDVAAFPASTPWRAPLVTPWPVARGPETAIVTGSDGEEIFTDNYGRVKIRFHWDRSGSAGDKSTCWIRVSHSSAGAGYNNIILPRVGQEVIVDFLDGDPDRPIITGRVYNAINQVPYALPDQKTKSTWKSHSTPKGEGGFNEIRMEDLRGQEELYVHAQKDRNVLVENDDGLTVKHDRTVKVINNDSLTVEEGNETVKVSEGNMSIDVAEGDYSLKTDLGSVSIEALQQIQLKVGENTITITQSGIAIKGVMITAEARFFLQAKAPITQVQGSALMMVKGGIVLIN